jgi:hypothetical protein
MAQLKRNVVTIPGGVKLVYCTAEGRFIGELICTGMNSAALRAMAEDFRDFTEEEAAALASADPSPEVSQTVARILRQ